MKYSAQPNIFNILLSILLFIIVALDCFIGSSIDIICTISVSILLWISLLREYYIIESRILDIKRGFLVFHIVVDDIKRINIAQYGGRTGVEIIGIKHTITVYPKNILQFVDHLMKINPDIEIENNFLNRESIIVR